jgi:opacity protein-like surface antigen
MKRLLSHLALALAGLASTSFASATVLNFDDITADDFVSANYGGLDWSAGDWFAYGQEQAPYTPHSGDVRIASGFGDPDSATAIGLGSGMTFQGAWFAGLEGATVTFQLYDHGTLVATSATLDPSATPTWLASGYTGLVDKILVSSPDQGSFVMDDLTFAAAVPEPASMTLMFGGLLALAAVARRRA